MDMTSNEKISEALRLLEEAAREKKDEFRTLVGDKYSHLKSALGEAQHSAAAAEKRAIDALLRAKELGVERARETAAEVDKRVRANPWPYIRGAAVVAFLCGVIMGRKR
jgi:ElaB/YqjD/DUF883 family membrane-anchored ribosome-binding protein